MYKELSAETLSKIANTYGTPVYVYDTDKISHQFEQLNKEFAKTNTRFFYASKALTNINILQHILNIGCNIDCSSINEAKLAIHTGFEPTNILYTSNGIDFSEIEEAAALGVHINIDSLSNLEKFGKKFGHSYPVGIRLRPNIMAGGNLKISTGHQSSKFGIPIEQLNEILQLVKKYNLYIRGLHIHTGSEIKDVAVFMKVADIFVDLIPHFPEVSFLDLGGGFKVAYKEKDPTTDIAELAHEINILLTGLEKTHLRQFECWFEPGKYLVSEAGYLVTKVNVLKDFNNIAFAGVDSGLNHLIRPMMYDAYHRIENISNTSGNKKNYTITGNICETDTFGSDRLLHEVREGDFLAIYNAGAYGFEMSSNYNARFKPAEVMVKEGIPQLIRKRDVFADLLRNQTPLI
ncbi:MAG: diaminopimelate decarboxylase [Bacteroidetes bacterium]|nr:diaminopimelate decarboxylase [Bacteroidota bacterium]